MFINVRCVVVSKSCCTVSGTGRNAVLTVRNAERLALSFGTPESHVSGAKRPLRGWTGEAGSTADMLETHLMGGARKRTVLQAVSGGRFCAVMLDDGGVGVANLCRDVCGRPSRRSWCSLPEPGTSAADALATLSSPERSAVGLATANALANRFAGGPNESCGNASWYDTGRWRQASVGNDILDVVELRPDDHVGMVGCFSPMVDRIRQRVQRLCIFERGQCLVGDLLPEDQAAALLPRCSVALITATALIDGTIDELLTAAQDCREVVLLGLLKEAKVSTTPGIAFGPTGEAHLRLSFCVSAEEINKAFDRMEAFFG